MSYVYLTLWFKYNKNTCNTSVVSCSSSAIGSWFSLAGSRVQNKFNYHLKVVILLFWIPTQDYKHQLSVETETTKHYTCNCCLQSRACEPLCKELVIIPTYF